MLLLDYNTISLVGSSSGGRGKRKAALVVEEDSHARNEKKRKQVSQLLIESARKGDLTACIQAIRDGADVSFQSCGMTALFYAAFYGHDMIIDYLVNCGASVNEKNLSGVTPLAKAVESTGPDVVATVQCLLRHRADPNIADVNGNTPLIKAVKSGNVGLVKCLVGNKATDVNRQNYEKNTALHEAAFKGSKEMVDSLLAAGANVNVQNSAGKAPLHRAVSGDHLAVANTLLDHGAFINSQDSLGYTPCHYTAFFGFLECTKFLVEHGASLDLRERISKKNILELAQERRHYPVVEYLSRVVKITIPFLTVSYSSE